VDLAGGAVWIGVSVTPADRAGNVRTARGSAIGAALCGPDGGPPAGEWAIELHTDRALPPRSQGAAKPAGPAVGPMLERMVDPEGPCALTHARLVCHEGRGESSRAVRFEPPVLFGADELALVRVEVRRAPEVRVPAPRIVIRKEPEPEGHQPRLSCAPQEGLKGGSMARRALGAIEDQIKQARELMDRFVTLNPSRDDKNEVDLKLSKCEGLYEAENIVNLPLITHIASSVCFDELIDKLQSMVARYTRTPVPTPGAKPAEGMPWYAWAGIGLGALAGLGFLAWAVAPKPAAAPGRRAA